MNQVKIFFSVIALLVIGVVSTAFLRSTQAPVGPGKYDVLAQCLTDKGAKFYGAFWCPHCQAQKKMFGSSAKLLPYVECSLPSGNGQTQECIEKKIESYPTWEFSDGSRLTGEVAIETLAERTSCVLPNGGVNITPLSIPTVGESSPAQ